MFGPNVPRCGFPFISTAFRRHGDHEQKARTEDHSDADPTGNFLYVAHTVGGAITGYVINPATGVPAKIAVLPWPAGISPVASATACRSS